MTHMTALFQSECFIIGANLSQTGNKLHSNTTPKVCNNCLEEDGGSFWGILEANTDKTPVRHYMVDGTDGQTR